MESANEKLRDDLLKIAEEQLASAQVEVLKRTFDDLADAEDDLLSMQSTIEVLEKRGEVDREIILTLKGKVMTDTNLMNREHDVSIREQACEIGEVKLQCEIEKRQLAVELFSMVFLNV